MPLERPFVYVFKFPFYTNVCMLTLSLHNRRESVNGHRYPVALKIEETSRERDAVVVVCLPAQDHLQSSGESSLRLSI
jgi:hypothetical protein